MKNIFLLSIGIFISLETFAFNSSANADIYDATVICTVKGIKTGQLALRSEPNGEAFAGLNNGNVVRAIAGILEENGTVWEFVRVQKGPNSQVNGREGYVNSNYLTCKWYDENGNFIRQD